ncbi:hypothetical protein DEO72_LG10g1444 [Vigna unguiculata]|uniref:Uncharacterized protein n=1 Tax=Vigna unguiculata TaxID=3917 RepID=A0A4D6NEA8_VIGUN|nr:hypothetical protein DEO72_LG10g1444 [Vigna unguiculata]
MYPSHRSTTTSTTLNYLPTTSASGTDTSPLVRIVARTDNLAQANLSRLGEISRGSLRRSLFLLSSSRLGERSSPKRESLSLERDLSA